jgi:hypothetical protein
VETSDGKAINHGEGQRRESCEELSCDAEEPSQLNPEAPECNPRPRRQVAAVASQRIQEIVKQENEEH